MRRLKLLLPLLVLSLFWACSSTESVQKDKNVLFRTDSLHLYVENVVAGRDQMIAGTQKYHLHYKGRVLEKMTLKSFWVDSVIVSIDKVEVNGKETQSLVLAPKKYDSLDIYARRYSYNEGYKGDLVGKEDYELSGLPTDNKKYYILIEIDGLELQVELKNVEVVPNKIEN